MSKETPNTVSAYLQTAETSLEALKKAINYTPDGWRSIIKKIESFAIDFEEVLFRLGVPGIASFSFYDHMLHYFPSLKAEVEQKLDDKDKLIAQLQQQLDHCLARESEHTVNGSSAIQDSSAEQVDEVSPLAVEDAPERVVQTIANTEIQFDTNGHSNIRTKKAQPKPRYTHLELTTDQMTEIHKFASGEKHDLRDEQVQADIIVHYDRLLDTGRLPKDRMEFEYMRAMHDRERALEFCLEDIKDWSNYNPPF
jgi:hypothetical protein